MISTELTKETSHLIGFSEWKACRKIKCKLKWDFSRKNIQQPDESVADQFWFIKLLIIQKENATFIGKVEGNENRNYE